MCRHVPTPVGADTCRHLWYQSYGLNLDTERCRHVLAYANTSRCRHRCRHIYVRTHLCADTCWHMNVIWKLDVLTYVSISKVPTPEKVPIRADNCRCRHVLTPVGADTCDISHMDFTWILGCAGKCQHLERCRHLERYRLVLACANTSSCMHRCRHIYMWTHLCADTCWHMNVTGSWDVLTCVSTSKVPTPEKVPTRADTCRFRHVPTPVGAYTCRHLWYQSYGLYLDTGMCWQMPAPWKVHVNLNIYQIAFFITRNFVT